MPNLYLTHTQETFTSLLASEKCHGAMVHASFFCEFHK